MCMVDGGWVVGGKMVSGKLCMVSSALCMVSSEWWWVMGGW